MYRPSCPITISLSLKLVVIFFVFLVCFLFFSYLHTNEIFYSKYLRIERFDLINLENYQENKNIELSYERIVYSSEKVYLDGALLLRDIDYSISYHQGYITPLEFFQGEKLVVKYYLIPDFLQQPFYEYLVQNINDLEDISPIEPRRRIRHPGQESMINVTGTKTFSMRVSRTDNFTLDQSLFLKISGNLTEHTKIEAQLSDTYTPISAEGQSKELADIEQLYIKIFSEDYELNFGKLEAKLSDSFFLNYSTSIEGIKAKWKKRNIYKAAIAVSDNKPQTNTFWGSDGKQGPYHLSTGGLPDFVTVIPGSESVYLNGRLISRNTDYIIDYHEGHITFNSKHIITSRSFIMVNFLFSDQDYKQFLYLNSNRVYLTNRLYFQNNLIILRDDKNNPLNFNFSNDDIDVLKKSGDGKAYKSGVVQTKPGQGDYILVPGEPDGFYRYVGEGQGEYRISFSYVGPKEGSYNRISFGHFEFAGEGKGSWIPHILLPSPQFQGNYNLLLRYENESFNFTLESFLTNHDKNTYSKLDNQDNMGKAAYFEMEYKPDFDRINPENSLYVKYESKNLSPLGFIRNPIIIYNLWEFQQYENIINEQYDHYEFANSLKFHIPKIISPELNIFSKYWDTNTFQTYANLAFRVYQKLLFPQTDLALTRAEMKSEDAVIGIDEQSIKFSYAFKPVALGSEFRRRESDEKTSDLLRVKEHFSQKYLISSHNINNFASQIYYLIEDDTESKQNITQSEHTTHTIASSTNLSFKQQQAEISLSQSVRKQPGEEKDRFSMYDISLNNRFFHSSISSVFNYSLYNMEYYPLIRKLTYVGNEEGVYDSTGVVTDDGEYDYVYIKEGDPVLSTETKNSLNLYINPVYYFGHALSDNSVDIESHFLFRELTKVQIDMSYLEQKETSRKNNEEINTSEIFARSYFRNSTWYNLIQRKLMLRHVFQQENLSDRRFTHDKEQRTTKSHEFLVRFISQMNTDYDLMFRRELEDVDFRYRNYSSISEYYSLDIQNRFGASLFSRLGLAFSREAAESSVDSTIIRSFFTVFNLTAFFTDDTRFVSRLSYRYNKFTNRGFFWFEPDKSSKNVYRGFLSLNKRIGSLSNINLEYSADKHDNSKINHNIKAELIMEF